jgi:O-antigen/teichoic acid export membrane protein
VWSAGFSIFRDVLQFAVTLFLVRLLTPEAYGQFGLAISIIGFLNVFSCQSFMAHALQVPDEADAHYQDGFTAGGVTQISLMVLTNLVALALWWSPTYRPIVPLLHVMSLTFLLDWPSYLRTTMLERDLDWRRLRSLHGLGAILAAAASLLFAALGAGVYALVVPGMVLKRVPFIYDLFVRHRWRPSWRFSRSAFAPALRFAFARTGSALVATVRQLLESGLLVHAFGFALFGVYGRAIGLAQLACQKLAVVGVQGLYPVMTKVEPGTAAAKRVASVMLRAVAWCAVPVALLLWVMAEPVVEVVYGGRWAGVVPMLGPALLMSALGAVAHSSYYILLANRQQKRCLALDVAGLVSTVAALAIALPYGSIAYLQAQAAAQALVLTLAVGWLLRDGTLSPAAVRGTLMVPVISGGVSVLGCELLRHALGADLHGPALLVYAALFAAGYLGGLSLLAAAELRELLQLAPFRRRLAPSAAAE